MLAPTAATRGRGSLAVAAALLAGTMLCWILITPPGAGPDEPGHLVRAGAVIRGDLDGDDVGELSREAYELPDSYLVPEPACYAFSPDIAVDCVAPIARTGGEVTLTSRADEYPLGGHLVYGAASLLPALPAVWWARLAGGLAAMALVTGAVAAVRRHRADPVLASAALLAALTPMAWGTFALVNPSAFGIAGAVALWTALLLDGDERSDQWLLACAWTALALPRRDGLIWACLALALVLIAHDRNALAWWRRLGRGPQVSIGAATAATVAWGATTDSRVSQLVALAPLVVVAAELGRRARHRYATDTPRRVGLIGGGLVVAVAGTIVLVRSRPGGWDGDLARRIVGQTGVHLVEAVGVIGWLDTELPVLAVAAWFAIVGLLATAAFVTAPRAVAIGGAVLMVVLVTSWVFELYQGNTTGRYWQGRYSLPMLVGIPIALGTGTVAGPAIRRLGRVVGVTALTLLNVAAWSAARRWGVGTAGSYLPWDWDTVHHPIAPVLLLVAHALCTAGLAWWLLEPAPPAGREANAST